MKKEIKVQFIHIKPRKEDIDNNLYYFDMRNADMGRGYTIERNVWANNIGSLISNVDLLKDKDILTDEEFEKLDYIIVDDLVNEDEMEL